MVRLGSYSSSSLEDDWEGRNFMVFMRRRLLIMLRGINFSSRNSIIRLEGRLSVSLWVRGMVLFESSTEIVDV